MNTSSILLENASQFYIETPMVKALHERITQWTWCGLTGGVVVGDARLGKTVAFLALSDSIDSRKGQKIPIFKITYGKRDLKTIRTVFAKVARALGFTFKDRTGADDLSEMICIRLAEAAMMNDTHQVILLVDEAQLLSIDQLSVFADIYNELFDMHVNLVVFFIANKDQFKPLSEKLLQKDNTYLRERFFNNLYEFHGLRNVDEVRACLDAYDNYMMDSERRVSATKHYCTVLYYSGWRLSHIADLYWNIYCEQYKIPLNHSSWGMNLFIRTTNILLMDYLSHCPIFYNQSYIEGCIIKSMEAAGITPTLIELIN